MTSGPSQHPTRHAFINWSTGSRAGLSKHGARFEAAAFAGPNSVVCAKIFEEGHQIIMI